jgi:hypothetical protein
MDGKPKIPSQGGSFPPKSVMWPLSRLSFRGYSSRITASVGGHVSAEPPYFATFTVSQSSPSQTKSCPFSFLYCTHFFALFSKRCERDKKRSPIFSVCTCIPLMEVPTGLSAKLCSFLSFLPFFFLLFILGLLKGFILYNFSFLFILFIFIFFMYL